MRRIASQSSCTSPLIVPIIDPFASSILRAAETHFVWVVLGVLYAAPALGEELYAFFFSGFFAELQSYVSRDWLVAVF
jgi:hypothetical protein